jgi:hypothetical protein
MISFSACRQGSPYELQAGANSTVFRHCPIGSTLRPYRIAVGQWAHRCRGREGSLNRLNFLRSRAGADETIRVLKSAVHKAKLGQDEEPAAVERLDEESCRPERFAKGPSVGALIAEERANSHEYGGRSVFAWEPSPPAQMKKGMAMRAD